MSEASIFRAPAGTQNSDRDERRLAAIANAVVKTAGHGQGQWRASGRTTDTPSLKISNPLALPICWRIGSDQGSATTIGCAYPNIANDATYIGRLEYSNVLRVVDLINFCKLFDWIKLFNFNFIEIVNSLEYFYWKKYS